MNTAGYNGYFDNAATSFPKPEAVCKEMKKYLCDSGGTYGRAAHKKSLEVSAYVEDARNLLSFFLGTKQAENLVFTFNATTAINTVLNGLDLSQTAVLISPMEHNAVMRPLTYLKKHKDVKVKTIPHFDDGLINLTELKRTISKNIGLIIVNHQSNVNGIIQPIEDIKALAGNTPILIDASQSAGYIDIKIDDANFDFVAITGHKGLLGPTGIGCLYIKDKNSLLPLLRGGTGSKSESYDMPEIMPDKFEAGTPNIAGIYGLNGALKERPLPLHKKDDLLNLIEDIKNIEGYKIYCADNPDKQGNVFSITADFADISNISFLLSTEYSTQTRVGLHCAPLAHKTLGTFPTGTIRIAPSLYHTRVDFELLAAFLKDISKYLRKNT